MNSKSCIRAFARTTVVLAAMICAGPGAVCAQEQPEDQRAREVQRRLQIMRTAVDAFREAERPEWAQRIEQAMHALEVSLAAQRDEEAQRVLASAPPPGDVAELLHAAYQLHSGWNHPDRAEALLRLSETYGQEHQRRREAQGAEGQRREQLEHHLRVVDRARATYERAGWETNAGKLARAIEIGRGALQGSAEETERGLRESGLDLAVLAELMRGASRLASEQGARDDAGAFLEMSEHFAARARERGDEGAEDAQGRQHRLEIVRFARAAWDEAGHAEQSRLLEQFLHAGELQLGGASAEETSRAFAGLTMGLVIELLRGAADLYATRFANEQRAAACRELAEFYAQRPRTSTVQVATDRENPTEQRIRALTNQVEELQRALERVQQELRELSRR